MSGSNNRREDASGDANRRSGEEVRVLWDPEPPPHPSRGPLLAKLALVATVLAFALIVAIAGPVYLRTRRETKAAAASGASAQVASSASALSQHSTGAVSPKPVATTRLATPPDFSGVKSAVSPSLVKVIASTCQGTGTGTGFWIDDNTVLTSYQSVSQAVSVAIVEPDRRPVPATISGADPSRGVALLRPVGATAGPALRIGSSAPKLEDWVAVAGYPSRSTDIAVSQGQVSDSGIGFTHHQLRIRNLEALPGELDLSLGGAPVVNSDSTLVGAVFAVTAQPRRLFVPADQLRTGIQEASLAGSPEAGHCNRPTGPHSQTQIEGDPPAAMRRGLMTYFRAINSADYPSAFYKGLGPAYHGPGTATPKGWVSTYDFDIYVRAPESGSQQTAWITFDSIFAEGKGPLGTTTCARWSMDYAFTRINGDLIINRSKPHGGHAKAWQPC